MRRQILALIGLIGVLMLGSMRIGQTQDKFRQGVGALNQPVNHWAYAAVEDLAQTGILEGYPDGNFRGNRALTRYEFAVAMKRFMDYFAKQNEPRKVTFLETLNSEMARVWEEADKLAEIAEVPAPKKTTSAVSKSGKLKIVP